MNHNKKLNDLGLEFIELVRKNVGLDGDTELDNEIKNVFNFVIWSFIKKMPIDNNSSMEEVCSRFNKALPNLTIQTCSFIEQVLAYSESTWES